MLLNGDNHTVSMMLTVCYISEAPAVKIVLYTGDQINKMIAEFTKKNPWTKDKLVV